MQPIIPPGIDITDNIELYSGSPNPNGFIIKFNVIISVVIEK